MILAIDGISVGLCAGADFGTEQAERYLPRNTCALIKSFFGFALGKVCPYLAACDLVVGENTCDGKKKAYETFRTIVPRLHIIDLPQVKSSEGRALMTAEYRRFARELEKLAGKQITVDALRQTIDVVNKKRSAVHRLAALRGADPAPISGLDALLVNQVYFYDDPVRFTASVNALCDELEQRAAKGIGVAPKEAARLVVSGCPMAVPNWKIPVVIEQAGKVIVGAANALSDVYAMGGRPLTALSIVGFPDATLPPEVLVEILRGASEKAAEAGIAIVGGHAIKSEEPIFGLAVVGTIAPDRVLANDSAQPGDVLVLTKPLWLGIITTAAKNDEDKLGAIASAVKVMTTLNRDAMEAIVRVGAHALTDVTGFGLLGHLRNMVVASNVSARVYLDRVPVLPSAWDYVRAGIAPGGTYANHRFLAESVTYAPDLTREDQLVLCDAQTSGGLLAAVAPDWVEELLLALRAGGVPEAALIGTIDAASPGRIFVARSETL